MNDIDNINISTSDKFNIISPSISNNSMNSDHDNNDNTKALSPSRVKFSNVVKLLPDINYNYNNYNDNNSNDNNDNNKIINNNVNDMIIVNNNNVNINDNYSYNYDDNDNMNIIRRVSSNGIVRKSRIVSLDSSTYLSSSERKRYDNNSSNINDNNKKRATSLSSSSSKIDKYLMRRITFEEVEVNSTPLSHMRSCSEFMANNGMYCTSNNNNEDYYNDKKSKFFAKYFSFNFFSKNKKANSIVTSSSSSSSSSSLLPKSSRDILRKRINKCNNDNNYSNNNSNNNNNNNNNDNSNNNYEYDDDERRFFIENMTGVHGIGFNEYDTEVDDDYSNPTYGSSSLVRDLDRYGRPSCFSFNLSSNDKNDDIIYEHRRSIEADINPIEFARRMKMTRIKKQKLGKTSLMFELTSALDIVFSFNSNYRRGEPMEIELKEFSNLNSTSRGSSGIYDGIDRGDIPLANVHQRTIDRIVSEIVNGRINPHSNNDIRPNIPLIWSFRDSTTWTPSLLQFLKNITLTCRRYFIGASDDAYYELIRIQPFASGAYIRGILASGFCSLFFNAYSLALWPDFVEIKSTRKNTIILLYSWLIFQFLLNLIQFPLRLKLHYRCWESSRATDVESAVTHLRNMVQSDAWLYNRIIGRVQDIITFFSIIAAEIFLWSSNIDEPLRFLVNSLIATNMLALIVRIFAVTVFSISMHDPTVLAEARKRGLSRWDIEGLPTFVFTNLEEVNNGDCSICLNSFDLGDMLISLPCDSKHSFHANCIRQWLTRQNSCPLCQRGVGFNGI